MSISSVSAKSAERNACRWHKNAMISTVDRTSQIIHDLTQAGQMFKSYADLMENNYLNLSHKKMKEICQRCAQRCLDTRNLILEGVKDNE